MDNNNQAKKTSVKNGVEQSKFCKDCGTKIDEDAKFCPFCGKKQ